MGRPLELAPSFVPKGMLPHQRGAEGRGVTYFTPSQVKSSQGFNRRRRPLPRGVFSPQTFRMYAPRPLWYYRHAERRLRTASQGFIPRLPAARAGFQPPFSASLYAGQLCRARVARTRRGSGAIARDDGVLTTCAVSASVRGSSRHCTHACKECGGSTCCARRHPLLSTRK